MRPTTEETRHHWYELLTGFQIGRHLTSPTFLSMLLAATLYDGTQKLVTATERAVINFHFYTDYRHLKLQYAMPYFGNCNAKTKKGAYNVILTVIIIAGLHKYRAPSRPGNHILYTLTLNICGFSVWNLLHVTLLALRNLRWFLDFRRIYGPLNYRISSLLWVSDVSGVTAMGQHLVTTAFCPVPAITLILVVPGLCLYASFVC